jgi:N12 class adenine-specific DNA methylase
MEELLEESLKKPKINFDKKKTIENNIEALEIAFKIQGGHTPSPEEKAIMKGYAGWGGIKEVLLPINDLSSWNKTDQKVYNEILKLHEVLKEYTAGDEKLYNKYIQEIKSNTLSAFYTPQRICDTIVEALQKEGFEPKTIIEPSSGTGRFIDSVKNILGENNHITAVEKDSLTSLILKGSNADVRLFTCGLEETQFDNKKFDLVISNIPFGNFRVYDPQFYSQKDNLKIRSSERIHNYFFIKGLDLAENKGVLAFITTSSFSDSPSNEIFRKHLVENGDLKKIIRLPNNLFKSEAGTEAGTDLIIIQRNDDKKELSDFEKDFIKTETINNININGTFVKNNLLQEENIIATSNIIDTNQYGKAAYVHNFDGSIDDMCLALSSKLGDLKLEIDKSIFIEKDPAPVTGNIKKPKVQSYQLNLFDEFLPESGDLNIENSAKGKSTEKEIKNEIRADMLDLWYEKDSVFIHENKICKVDEIDRSKNIIKFSFVDSDKIINEATLKDYISLREKYFDLLSAETLIQIPQDNKRKELNEIYESFIKDRGQLHDKKNIDAIDIDLSFNKIVGSLEKREYKDDKYIFVKGDILEKPINIDIEEERKYEINSAISISLNKYGKINFGYLGELTGKSTEELQTETKGILYLNHRVNEWETADRFLSGNVVEKKEYYDNNYSREELTEKNSIIEESYSALCTIQPKEIPFELIDINLGERWIKNKTYEDFATWLFRDNSISVVYSKILDQYDVKRENNYNNPLISEQYAVKSESRTFTGIHLLEHALQNTTPHITYKILDGDKVITMPDKKAMREATQKTEAIRNKFSEYLKELPQEKKDYISDYYNKTYNCYVKRKYDGSHLAFADLQNMTPFKHQKDATWMILQNNGGIVDHPVGSGKTLVMAMAAHEMKRLGIAKKPAILGLKANIVQIAEEYKKIYPHDKILFPTKEDLNNDNRPEFFQQMQNQDWDCIIMTHEQFQKISQSPEVEKRLIQEELKNIEDNLEELRRHGGKISKAMLRGLEIRKNNKAGRLALIADSIKRDDRIVNFETMGIDHLFVDESQKFKNLEYSTRHDRVAGLGNSKGSDRAFNMLTAIRTIQERNKTDLGVTFLSGTTISNSLTEMYTLFKYLRPRELERQHINNFDSWLAVYAKKSVEYEFNITNELIMKERFRTFIKVPELSSFYNEITDFKSFKDLNLDRPEMNAELKVCKQTPEQKEFIKRLIEFAKTGNGELINRGKLSAKEMTAKMLIATNEAKKMALDMRLISESMYHDHVDNKISVCAKDIHEFYMHSQEYKGTQIVFCDTGTPTTDGFNIYSALKKKLVEYGIKPEEIAFVHSAVTDKQRAKLFERVNSGEIRVIVGSTEKLGTGVNAQQRVVAMHDLDIPWRPSDLEQRHGRGARQGNWVAKKHYNNLVKTNVYATENTLDVYKFNLLKNKQLFIDQIKNNSINKRTIDEGSLDEQTGMSFAEYIAILSGNNDLLERAKIENKIVQIESEKNLFFKDKSSAVTNLESTKKKIENNERFHKAFIKDKQALDIKLQHDKNGTRVNAIQLSGFASSAPEKIGENVINIFKTNISKEPVKIGDVYGFECYVQNNGSENSLYVQSTDTASNLKYTYNNGVPNIENPALAGRYFLNAISKAEKLASDYSGQIKMQQSEIPLYDEIIKKEWPTEKENKLQGLKTDLVNIDIKIQESIIENEKKYQNQHEEKNVDVDKVVEMVQEKRGDYNKSKKESVSMGNNNYETTISNIDNSKNPTLRMLDESKGEYSFVERKYSLDKNFSFMGTNKIESYNDVAFIFKNLQRASIENVFVLHVLPSGKPLVQHLSMGSFVGSIVYTEAIKDAASRFNSKEVYFIHNHPSGNLTPSQADIEMCKKFKTSLGSIAKDGIIIDTISGEYTVFSENEKKIELIRTPEGQTKKLNTFKFDKQVFSKNIEKKQIKSSADVASIVSSQRLNSGNNLSLLILSRQNVVTANIHLEYSDVNEKKLAEDMVLYTTRFGGTQAIIYGRSKEFSNEASFVNKIEGLKKSLKEKADVCLIDFINVKSGPQIDLFTNKGMEIESGVDIGISM